MVEGSVSNDPSSPNMYTRLLDVARKIDDQQMLARLSGVPNGDLVSVEARYHRKKGCCARYLKQTDVPKITQQDKNLIQKVIDIISAEFNPQIINEKKVFLLTTLKHRFNEIADEIGLEGAESYRQQYFKQQLIRCCAKLSFIAQPGRSDLVCSSDITVGDVLQKANELIKTLSELQCLLYEAST